MNPPPRRHRPKKASIGRRPKYRSSKTTDRKPLREVESNIVRMQNDQSTAVDCLPKAKLSSRAQSLAIAYVYAQKLGAPNETEWDGHHGTVSSIIRELALAPGSRETVWRVLRSLQKCHKNGVEYTGEQNGGSGGANRLIEPESLDCQIIADSMESFVGLRQTTTLLNENRIARGLQHVGVSAVDNAVKRLNPVYVNRCNNCILIKEKLTVVECYADLGFQAGEL